MPLSKHAMNAMQARLNERAAWYSLGYRAWRAGTELLYENFEMTLKQNDPYMFSMFEEREIRAALESTPWKEASHV